MSEEITGGCLCGQTRFVVRGEVRFSLRCFCRDCQHVSGGGHALQVALPRDGFEIEGALATYRRPAASGHPLTFGFCRTCGAPVTKTTGRAPELIFVYAGALDDPTRFREPMNVYEESRQPWDTV